MHKIMSIKSGIAIEDTNKNAVNEILKTLGYK